MTKREFLDTLRVQLEGALTPSQVEGHLQYYNEYISEAVASGKTEQEVLAELGSPALIAKTILNTAGAAQTSENYDSAYQQNSYGYGAGENEYGYQEADDRQSDYFGGKIHTWNVNTKVLKWVIPIVVGVILFLAFSLIGSLIMLVARFFIPLLLIVLVISLFKKHGGR